MAKKPPSSFSLAPAELEQMARVMFAKIDVLQENLPAVLHVSLGQVSEAIEQLALKIEEAFAKPIRDAGRSAHKLPSRVRADLHCALYDAVSGAAMAMYAQRIADLCADLIENAGTGGRARR